MPYLEPEEKKYDCRNCYAKGETECTPWESSCGGYEDYLYHCLACGKKWWVEGIDS
jgi:hypothetical protein